MVEMIGVNKQYGRATVLRNINLKIDEPGIYCLLGRNGAGKTTFLKSVAGYQNITDGKIKVNGKVITTATLDSGEFATIRSQAGLNSYKISVKEWVQKNKCNWT